MVFQDKNCATSLNALLMTADVIIRDDAKAPGLI